MAALNQRSKRPQIIPTLQRGNAGPAATGGYYKACVSSEPGIPDASKVAFHAGAWNDETAPKSFPRSSVGMINEVRLKDG